MTKPYQQFILIQQILMSVLTHQDVVLTVGVLIYQAHTGVTVIVATH